MRSIVTRVDQCQRIHAYRSTLEQAATSGSAIRPVRKGSFEYLYNVTASSINKARGGPEVLRLHLKSPTMAVLVQFPEHAWRPWKFRHGTPRQWWSHLGEAVRQGDPVAICCLRGLFEDEGLNNPTAFLKRVKSGSTLFKRLAHINTPNTILHLINGSVSLDPTTGEKKFYSARHFFTQYERKDNNGNVDYNPLYQVTVYHLLQNATGREIMSTYRSAHKALLVAYPDVALKPWKFRKPFKAWWDAVYANFHSGDPLVEAVVREYMDELYDEIVITSTPEVSSTPEKEHDKSRIAILSAWATVTNKQLGSTASRHIAKLGGIYVLLRRLYPPSEDAETSEIENQLWNKLRHRKFARFARRKQIIQKQLLNNVARVL